MLFFYSGDREKARAAMNAAAAKTAGKTKDVVRVSDASSVFDLEAALGGGGMFDAPRVVVLDGVSANPEMREIAFAALPALRGAQEPFFMFEEKPDAAARKAIEKYAEKSERFDAPKQKESGSIFALANALKRADRKALWVGLERELAAGGAPEAVHGVLFWGAKQMLLAARAGSTEEQRGQDLIAELAELPHEARRNNLPLDYALLRFALALS